MDHANIKQTAMKNLFTFIFLIVFLSNTNCGQTSLEQIVSTFNTPPGWTSKFIADSSFFPLFERRQMATWTFKNKSDSTIKVTFYVFNYTPKDSALFSDKEQKYIRLVSCLLVPADKPNENFTSFQRSNYFFLKKMCPCYTLGNEQCKQLAKQLFEWINRN